MTLLERHTPTLRAVIARRIPSRWRALLSADDVIQQTYVDAFLNIGRFEPQRGIGFEQWLMALAKYNLLDALRMFWAEKRGGRRQRVEPASREESFSTLYEALGGVTQTTPSRVAARREACDVMRAAIAQLPESYRCVVEMYDIEGRPIQEVAARLRRSPGAVYMLHARAHRMLAGMLGSSSQYLTG